MSGEFVAEYVQECVKEGIQFPADIRKRAEIEISEINTEIKKIESLRIRQGNLRAVIRHMGGGTKVKKTTSKTMDFTMHWEDLDESFKKICVSICLLIQNNDDGKMPGEIMDALSREQRSVYSAIKWLEHNEVVGRRLTDEGRTIVRGSKWHSFMAEVNPDESC